MLLVQKTDCVMFKKMGVGFSKHLDIHLLLPVMISCSFDSWNAVRLLIDVLAFDSRTKVSF